MKVLLKEDVENQPQVRTGCLGLVVVLALPTYLFYFGLMLFENLLLHL